MAARSIASLTLGFGLVSVPVKLYSATESSVAIRFNQLARNGARLKQQYIAEDTREVVERADMVKGYEFEKDRFVLFTPEELKALEDSASHAIEIVAFAPEKTVDPIYYDKAYLLAPDKRGAKPYTLLKAAMQKSGQCALARWSWKGKQYVVQVRPAEDGLVLQQLLYADEVRSLSDLNIEKVEVSDAELQLALQLIDQIAVDRFDPTQFHDAERKRILAAIDAKIAGKQVVASSRDEEVGAGAQVIDLMEALRASLKGKSTAGKAAASPRAATPVETDVPAPAVAAAGDTKTRKAAKRAPKADESVVTPATTRARKVK